MNIRCRAKAGKWSP